MLILRYARRRAFFDRLPRENHPYTLRKAPNYMNTKPLFKSLVTGLVAGIVVYGILAPQVIHADVQNITSGIEAGTLVKDGRLTVCKLDKSHYEVVKKVKMVITGYSSTPDQTDDTPFLTASQKHVEDGIIAINGLPFGTKVRIPSLYGDKVFTVEDRMNSRYGQLKRADIWFENTKDAINFGAKSAHIEILES